MQSATTLRKRFSYLLFITGAPIASLLVAFVAIIERDRIEMTLRCSEAAAFSFACYYTPVTELLWLLSGTGIVWPLLLALSVSRLCRDLIDGAPDRVRRIAQAAPVITGSIVAILLVQGLALAVALALLEFILTGRSIPILGAAIVASIAWISWRLLRLLFTQKAADLSSVVAVAARPDEQSRLWDLISTLAREGRGKMPDHILLGLYPNFYTSPASFKLSESEESLHGTALHLSLPLMRLLDDQELESVFRHELAHLSNDDLALTWNLHRATRQFELASQAIGRMNLLCVIAALPAITLLHFCLTCFQTLGNALRQSTELRADERTVAGSDPVVLMSALAKVSFATAFWPELEQTTAAKLVEGAAFINVSETFATGVSRTMAELGWDGVLADLDKRSGERPEASHPGIAGRCRNLGISLRDVTARPLKPAKSSLRVIARAEDAERSLSKLYQRHLVQSGQAKLGAEVKAR